MRGAPGEEIRQVEQMPDVAPGGRHVLFQPEQFWRLHFRRNNSPNEFQHAVTGGINTFCLRDCAVIHPNNNILLAASGRADGQRFAFFIQHDQRTGSVKTDSFYLNWVDIGLINRVFDGITDGLPDLIGRLFDEIRFRAVQGDLAAGLANHAAAHVEDARTGAASSYVYANKITCHVVSLHKKRSLMIFCFAER